MKHGGGNGKIWNGFSVSGSGQTPYYPGKYEFSVLSTSSGLESPTISQGVEPENKFYNKTMTLNIPAKLPTNDLKGKGFLL